jgi:hypothetical protein
VDTPGRSTALRSARTRPHRDRGGDTRRLDHPPHRSPGGNEHLARDPGRPQARAQPEQDPQACAVDVAQAGEVERDSGVLTCDALHDLLLDDRRVRQVDLSRDDDADGPVAPVDDDGGLRRRRTVPRPRCCWSVTA